VAPQPLGCAALESLDKSDRGFRVPTKEQRTDAIGGAGGTPFLMQRIMRFAEAWFEPILEPRSHDWLSQHRELMQNFTAFRSAWEEQREFIGPSAQRCCIHILPLGPQEPTLIVQQAIQEALTAFFFPLRVAIIKRKPGSKRSSAAGTPRTGASTPRQGPSTPRQGPSTPRAGTPSKGHQLPQIPTQQIESHEQELSAEPLAYCLDEMQEQRPQLELPKLPKSLNGEEVLSWMASGVRSDSAITIGLTLSKLTYHGTRTVGATNWSDRVGVFSLADVISDVLSPIAVERAVKFILHHVMHMMGVLHCCYYRCLMNGAANQEEADGRPPYLCAICLRKLHLVLGMDPLLRYMHLAHFWVWAGNPQIALWYETRVRVIRSTFSSSPVNLPPPSSHRPGSKGSMQPKRPASEREDDDEDDGFGDGSASSDPQSAWWRSSNRPATEGNESPDMHLRSPRKSPSRRRASSGGEEDLDRKQPPPSWTMSKEEEEAAKKKWDAIAEESQKHGYSSVRKMSAMSTRVMISDDDLAGLGLPPVSA